MWVSTIESTGQDSFTEAAENAFGQVDFITRSAAGAIVALFRLNGDRHGRADRLAQFAGDAALFPVGIAALRMQTAKTRALRRFLPKLHSDLALEEMTTGQRQALDELDEGMS